MNYKKIVLSLIISLLLGMGLMYAAMADQPVQGSKKLDLSKWHNVGNIWLRVSNYGFFGSGSPSDGSPQYPSLEYPGGSGIDYLYQGALWFGAKKYRRDSAGRKLFWLSDNPNATNNQVITQSDTAWTATKKPVVDTLVTVGFDGDASLYEFLPAYNQLVLGNSNMQSDYNFYNLFDNISAASIRNQRRGEDDDGDGIIDEDGIGYTFPFRVASELPAQFASFGSSYIHDTNNFGIVSDVSNLEIWFPLGFMDLSDTSYSSYAFTMPYDDDGDGRIDEDGFPVSEQDYISYYYDYCPFGTVGDRDLGSSRISNTHVPLNVRVRQMSYQWSFEYIKNLVYVEFNITNMNIATQDTLFDCAMGIYMDCDAGPQSWGSEKASDDVSGYVKGEGYEFAYTRDFDGDGGLTTGLVGARVCTPDPDELEFDCWYWKVGDGPDDFKPRDLHPSFLPRKTANEKYWLLTGRNPNEVKFKPLRPQQEEITEYEQPDANDTRFLFSFYGDMQGMVSNGTGGNGTDASWNLAPGKTMKIVVGVFPGDNFEDLKRSANWAMEIYGIAQTLTTVVLPDTFPHYDPPEPPAIPKLYAEMVNDGNRIDLWWDNRSEFAYDVKTVTTAELGWQPTNPAIDSHISNYNPLTFPEGFEPPADPLLYVYNAKVNPYTAHRLRHDFQGYTVWGRSGSGSREDWDLIERWDKVETAQDLADYDVNFGTTAYKDFGGYLGIDKNLPDVRTSTEADTMYYRLNDTYALVPIVPGVLISGEPLYNHSVDWSPELQAQADALVSNPDVLSAEDKILRARLFKNPRVENKVFDELFDDKLIPLENHGGQVFIPTVENGMDYTGLIDLKKDRLARRYYKHSINYPPKGVEYYLAVTAYDRGIPSNRIEYLETGRDADANMKVFFPGSLAKSSMDNIYVVPNPYIGRSKFDGRRPGDDKGDKSRRLWFVNIPEHCVIRIYTLAGDLVQSIEHNGAYEEDIINVSKAADLGITASGIRSWDLLSKNRQVIAPGVYLFSVENKADGKLKVGKFAVIK